MEAMIDKMRNSCQPSLIVLNGLPGAGKTTLATALAKQYSAIHLSTDSIRRELFGTAEMVDVRFSNQASAIVYEVLLLRAEIALPQGRLVVSDGMNNYPPGWQRYLGLSERTAAALVFVDILVSTNVLRERVARRRESGMTLAIHDRLLAEGNDHWVANDPEIRHRTTVAQWRQEEEQMTFFRSDGSAESLKCTNPSEAAAQLRNVLNR